MLESWGGQELPKDEQADDENALELIVVMKVAQL